MSDVQKFDFKRCWLDLSPAEREEFASDAGTTSHYIQVHLTGRRRIPRKPLLERLFKACKSRKWISGSTNVNPQNSPAPPPPGGSCLSLYTNLVIIIQIRLIFFWLAAKLP